MFGYNRRPELFKVLAPALTFSEWMDAAIGSNSAGSRKEIFAAAAEQRALYLAGSGLKKLILKDELLHAAPKVAELWAFQTGRLP